MLQATFKPARFFCHRNYTLQRTTVTKTALPDSDRAPPQKVTLRDAQC